MIETEKATDALDLPHAFVWDASDGCKCGRPKADEIHGSAAREVASHAEPAVITEKGS
jgi:hypothetical protein